MTLSALIRKRESGTSANANPAKAANDGQGVDESLAKLAPLALANPTDAKTADALTSWGWLLHFADREPLEVYCNPDATHAEILERYPDALAAEPFTPTIRQPSVPLTASDETAIRAWLALIEETDPATIGEVVSQCQRDADARDYFTGRAELPKPGPFPDDRRTCDQCRRLNPLGRCIASQRGEIAAIQTYEPVRDILRRCEGYMPRADDPDTRPGRERWPELIRNQESNNV